MLSLVLDREPHVSLIIEFIHKFEERTSLEELIADLVLDIGDHLKELGVVDLWVSHDVAERVGQGGLKLQERLEGHLVDVFETITVEIGEVLCLKLPDEFFIGICEEHLPYGSARIYIEYLFMQLLLDKSLCLFLIDDALFYETVNDECFLFSLGDLNVEECVDFVDVVVHGFLVVERMLMEVELVFFDEFLWSFELAAEEVCENAGMCHYLMILDVGIDQQFVK